MIASARGCGDDDLQPVGDGGGSSFAVTLDMSWYPGVMIFDFATNLCSVPVFPGLSERLYLMIRKTESCGCARKAWEVSLSSSK